MDIQSRTIHRVRLLVALILFLVLEGCGSSGGPRPDVSFQLAVKANNFMKVASLLIAQGPEFWGQGLRSLYYSALTLARLKDVNTFCSGSKDFHSKVWGRSPIPIRKYFEEMKNVRTRHDYKADVGQSDAEYDFVGFIQNGMPPFEGLLDQAKINIDDDYKRCTNIPSNCKHCKEANVSECLKKSAIIELESVRNTLLEIVTVNTQLSVTASSCEENIASN
jgi:hypothetical protein